VGRYPLAAAVALVVAVLLAGDARPQPSSPITWGLDNDAVRVHTGRFDLNFGSGVAGSLTPVTNTSVAPSTMAAGATGVRYVVRFTTSSTGQLVFPGGITLTAPQGTFTGASFQTVDTTQNRNIGAAVQSNDGARVVLRVTSHTATAAGDVLEVTVTGATNSTAGQHNFTVSTSSDTQTVTTPSYTLVTDTTAPRNDDRLRPRRAHERRDAGVRVLLQRTLGRHLRVPRRQPALRRLLLTPHHRRTRGRPTHLRGARHRRGRQHRHQPGEPRLHGDDSTAAGHHTTGHHAAGHHAARHDDHR
jgi:hypothetical protein